MARRALAGNQVVSGAAFPTFNKGLPMLDTSVLFDLLRQATHNDELRALAGLDDDECPSELAKLERALAAALRDVRQVRSHVHEWDDNQYCSICGADGNA